MNGKIHKRKSKNMECLDLKSQDWCQGPISKVLGLIGRPNFLDKIRELGKIIPRDLF